MTTPRIPPLDLLFGYGPAVLIILAGVAAWEAPAAWQPVAVAGGWLGASAILLFLAGVTRGLSFFTADGPRPVQVAQSVWLLLLGLGSLAGPMWTGLVLLVLGYASIALFDPPAARRGLAPAHFARLRPPQMGIIIVGLVLLLVRAMHG